MKKTLLSLTAAALLCTALPQQTLAVWPRNRAHSGEVKYRSYPYRLPYDNRVQQPSNPCSRFISNASHTASSAWSDLEGWKKALLLTGITVVGGTAIAIPWLGPAVANAIATTATTLAPFSGQNDSFILDNNGTNPFPALNFITKPEPSKILIENAVEALEQKGSLPLEMAKDLTPEEAETVAKKYRNNVIPISSDDFENCVKLRPSEWSSYMDRIANSLSNYAAWNQLANIAQRPFDQYGSLRSAGEIAQYGALSKQQIGSLLDVIQKKGALGMQVTIDGTPVDVTCSRVAEAAQKLTLCPAAWKEVKQAAKIKDTPSCYQELVQAAKAGYNLGDISNSHSIPDEDIKGAMNAALEAGKLGLFYQVNGKNVPYACYAVLRNHAAKFGAPVPQEGPAPHPPADNLCPSSFTLDLRRQHMSAMQSQAIQKAANMWQKVITGYQSGQDIRLTIDCTEGDLNQHNNGPSKTLGMAGIDSCHPNTAATQHGSITLDDRAQQSFSDYWSGGTSFSAAAHEIGHLLLPLAKIPGPFRSLPNGQAVPSDPRTACQTSHYFQSTNNRGDGLFTGPKTIAYFQKLATARGLDPNRFNAGVPISGGHPSSDIIDYLAHESGFFGNPPGTPLEEYILHMLEDVGYCIDWNAAKPYMHQNNAQSAW